MARKPILWMGAALLAGCANLSVATDSRTRAYADAAPLAEPAFHEVALLVSGAYSGGGRRYPGAALRAERAAWNAFRTALEAKRVVGAVGGAETRGDAEILVEFLLEDDDDTFHAGFSLLTLHVFPHWKMVRLSVRVRCKTAAGFLPGFDFEDERLVYRSPVLLPLTPFAAADPVRELCTAAAQGFAMHVLRSVNDIEPLVAEAGAPGDD
ncbi:MAG: hypothetical protein JXQ29_02040 [Planctomycetes bacterium]|nr:hypothetical protein [Planctomycetota bacterium]